MVDHCSHGHILTHHYSDSLWTPSTSAVSKIVATGIAGIIMSVTTVT
jgi:hypothetical protein